jgi:hypothetical protein
MRLSFGAVGGSIAGALLASLLSMGQAALLGGLAIAATTTLDRYTVVSPTHLYNRITAGHAMHDDHGARQATCAR